MIPSTTARLILETARIEEVIFEFLPLRRSGANLTALCPFHHEKTPSFSVSPVRNTFKCFGCGKGGNAAKFLIEHEGYSFPEALRWLARKYNIEMQEIKPSPEQLAAQQAEESLFIVNDFTLQFFQNNRPGIGLEYLKGRGFSEATIQKFGLGFAPDRWDGLTKVATQAGFKLEYLQKLGLTTSNNKDFFRNRVIFPINNLGGKVIAFAGRTINNETIQQSNNPKYLNSPESPIYHKSQTLYGIHLAKRAIRQQDGCILVEGYTDLIALHQAGIENAVASAGTSLTTEQLLLIRRFTSNLHILYDGDPAGIGAALRGLDLALELDLNVKVTPLPHPDDPDSFLHRVGKTAFVDYLQHQAKDFINFKASTLLARAANDPVKKAAAVHAIVDSIARVSDSIKRSFFIKDCAALVGLSEDILTHETTKAMQALAKRQHLVVPMQPISDALSRPKESHERHLVRLLLEHGSETFDAKENITVAEHILGNIEDILEYFEDPICQRICRESIELVLAKQPVSAHYFIAHEDLAVSGFSADLLHQSTIEPDPIWERTNYFSGNNPDETSYLGGLAKAICHLKLKVISQHCEQNLQLMKDIAPDDEQAMTRLLKVHEKLNRMRVELAKSLGLVKI